MSDMTFRARSLPYREPRPKAYDCGRCGIPVNTDPRTATGYCRDCRPYMEEMESSKWRSAA